MFIVVSVYIHIVGHLPAIALRQHSLMFAGHFSLHFSARFSLIVLLRALGCASVCTALVFVVSSPSADGLLTACLAIGPGVPSRSPDAGLVAALVVATPLPLPPTDLPNWSGLNRFWYNRSEILEFYSFLFYVLCLKRCRKLI